jgi:hypothetical protein
MNLNQPMAKIIQQDVAGTLENKIVVFHSVSNGEGFRKIVRFAGRNIATLPKRTFSAAMTGIKTGSPIMVGVSLVASPAFNKAKKLWNWIDNDKKFKDAVAAKSDISDKDVVWNSNFNAQAIAQHITHKDLNDQYNQIMDLNLLWDALKPVVSRGVILNNCDEVWSLLEHIGRVKLAAVEMEKNKNLDELNKLIQLGYNVLTNLIISNDNENNFQHRRNQIILYAQNYWGEQTLNHFNKIANGSKVFHSRLFNYDYTSWVASHNNEFRDSDTKKYDPTSAQDNTEKNLNNVVKSRFKTTVALKVASLSHESVVKSGSPLHWSGSSIEEAAAQVFFNLIYDSLIAGGSASAFKKLLKDHAVLDKAHFIHLHLDQMGVARQNLKLIIPIMGTKLQHLIEAVNRFMVATNRFTEGHRNYGPTQGSMPITNYQAIENLLQIQKYMDQVKVCIPALEIWATLTQFRTDWINRELEAIIKDRELYIDGYFQNHTKACDFNSHVCYHDNQNVQGLLPVSPSKVPEYGIDGKGNRYGYRHELYSI